MQPTTPQRAQGLDVSKWQGTPDWQLLRTLGFSFGFARAIDTGSAGTAIDPAASVDPTFASNWEGMKSAGMLRGAYMFYRIQKDPRQQAELFVKTVGALDSMCLPLALDVEQQTAPGVNPASVAQGVMTCLEAIAGLSGCTPILYTNPASYSQYLSNAAGLGRYPLWFSHIQSGPNPTGVPAVWQAWRFWQFAERAVPGYPSQDPFDLDCYNGSEQDLTNWLASLRVS